MLDRVDPTIWADVKARAAREGHNVKWIIFKLFESYAKDGLPANVRSS